MFVVLSLFCDGSHLVATATLLRSVRKTEWHPCVLQSSLVCGDSPPDLCFLEGRYCLCLLRHVFCLAEVRGGLELLLRLIGIRGGFSTESVTKFNTA